MASIDHGIGYRRNGKKQACEPCRKGKIACDHGTPHCGRCVRLKNTANCRYHPAPMTRGNGLLHRASTAQRTRPVSPEASSREAVVNSNYIKTAQYHSVGVQTTSPADPCLGKKEEESKSDWSYPRKSQSNWKKATYPRSSRYYGETSFKAMFQENETK